jgi:flagellar basal body-associated protein FliL
MTQNEVKFALCIIILVLAVLSLIGSIIMFALSFKLPDANYTLPIMPPKRRR